MAFAGNNEMRPVVGGLYAGKVFGDDPCVVVTIFEAGIEKRIRAFVVGRHIRKLLGAVSRVDMA